MRYISDPLIISGKTLIDPKLASTLSLVVLDPFRKKNTYLQNYN